MLKKYNICCIITLAWSLSAFPIKIERRTLLTRPMIGKSTNLESAKNLLKNYSASVDHTELQKLVAYLDYYKSWYLALTPAPLDLVHSLKPESIQVIDYIKELATPFVRNTPKKLMGASRLTAEGNHFYKELSLFAQKLATDNS